MFGQRKLLLERMQDLKEEHTKAMEKKDKQKDRLTEQDKQNLELLVRSNSVRSAK